MNSTFSENGVEGGGGTVLFDSRADYLTKISILESQFLNNNPNRLGYGATVEIEISQGPGEVLVERCKFLGSGQSILGNGHRGLVIVSPFGNSLISSTISNSIFTDNLSAVVFGRLSESITLQNRVFNNIFFNNGDYPIITFWNEATNSENYTEIYNNIVWEPLAELPVCADRSTLNANYLHHNLFSHLDCSLPGGDMACGPGNIVGQYPLFLDTLVGDFRTAACSPARNTGTSSPLILPDALDLAGQPRWLESRIDMGAYEQPSILADIAEIVPSPCYSPAGGTIHLDTIAAQLPLQVHWENADSTGSGLSELPVGPLELYLTDAQGCQDSFALWVTGPLPVSYATVINNAVNAQSADGSIIVDDVRGGTVPYRFTWSNGDTTAIITDLLPGEYTLTLTDAAGCTDVRTFTVSFTNNTNWLGQEDWSYTIYPNPVRSGAPLQIQFEQWPTNATSLQLHDALGRKVQQYATSNRPTQELPTNALPMGVYWLVLVGEHGEKVVLEKIVITSE